MSLISQLGPDFNDAFHYPEFRFVISTAAYLDPGLWERFQRSFDVRIVNVYGLTETVCEACYCGPDDESFRIGTVGKPVDCEARILGPDGASLPAGATGELALRGENIMSGYFRMSEETAEVLRDGWFRTGDLATIDEQSQLGKGDELPKGSEVIDKSRGRTEIVQIADSTSAFSEWKALQLFIDDKGSDDRLR